MDRNSPEQAKRSATSTGLLVKTLLSLFVLSGAFLIQQSHLPFTEKAKGFMNEVMTREFNFAGAVAWFEKYVGKTTEVLPTFSLQKKDANPVWNQTSKDNTLIKPVSGKISVPFTTDGKDIQIAASPGSEVKSAGSGWVVFIGPKEGMGQTVVIAHENQRQTWYGNVGQLRVAEQDWVQAGQVIGQVKEGGPVYFSVVEEGHFLDPTSVISFD